MFRWPNVPSPRANAHEIADFAELLSWEQGSASATELAQALGRLGENEYSQGVPIEDEIPTDVEGAFQEIERRIEASNGGYPFDLNANGTALSFTRSLHNVKHLAYTYLLLATRLDMNRNKILEGIDGTGLLEEMAAETARQYFGARAESLVFGTSEQSADFPSKVDNLCGRLEEGGGFAQQPRGARLKKDDKLDVVAWKPFADRREAKLIAFGQCKTGTSWKTQLPELQPDAFCRKWFQSQPATNPVRMFFVAEALSSVNWRNESIDAGLLFDRCRIVDYCDDLSYDLLQRILSWTHAAAEATGLPSSA